jgi:hypothetical protein
MTRCAICGTHVYRVGVVDASADRITFDEDEAHDVRFAWLEVNCNVKAG